MATDIGIDLGTATVIIYDSQGGLLLKEPSVIAVDAKTGAFILDALREVNREMGVTIVIVTHDMLLSSKVKRVVAIRDGKTSSEFIRRIDPDETHTGNLLDGISHEELVVLDRAGRLQVPREYLDQLGIQNRNTVRVELEDGRIAIYPTEQEEKKQRS